MTDLNDIKVYGRQPLFMPTALKDWLKNMDLNVNVVELFGPHIFKGEAAVYGYYVPDIFCVLAPHELLNEEIDLNFLESKFGNFSESADYIKDFCIIAEEKIMAYCHLAKPDWFAIMRQKSDETDETYFSRVYKQALTSDWRILTKHLLREENKYLSWDDLMKIFQLEEYYLEQCDKYLIETDRYIIYLHLAQYANNGEQVIFSHYCNDHRLKNENYILPEAVEEGNANDVYTWTNNRECRFLSLEEFTPRLYTKPIIKFDGDYHQKGSSPNAAFEYKFDGVFKVTGRDESGNFILERVH